MDLNRIQRIVAPVDFSELSALALRYAAMLARCSNAHITVLHADPLLPPPYFTERGLDRIEKYIQESRLAAEAYLREFVKSEIGQSDSVDIEMNQAYPADAIRDSVSRWQADMVVMGTHGRTGVNRLVLGSVTERVLREVAVPVLVVRQGHLPGKIARILCPVNDSDLSRRALRAAIGLARCTGARVTALHVREPGGKDAIPDLCAWAGDVDRAVCDFSEISSGADVAKEVITVAADSGSNLLVIGARHRRFIDTTILGANTIRILRHAPAPVLAVFGREMQA